MRAGYFPLANPLGHLTPPLPKSRSKSLIIGLSIFAVLFLAWGISMTVVYAHHTNTHNTTSIEHGDSEELQLNNEPTFRCSASVGQCVMTDKSSQRTRDKQPQPSIDVGNLEDLKFDSMQQCSESCVRSTVRLDMSVIPASNLHCDTGLTFDPHAKICVGSTDYNYEKCPWTVVYTHHTNIDQNDELVLAESSNLCPVPSSGNHWGCAIALNWNNKPITKGHCPKTHCSPGYKSVACGTPIEGSLCTCECDTNYKWAAIKSRFYPVHGNNLLPMFAAQTKDVSYCMDPKFVKTWVRLKWWIAFYKPSSVNGSKTCPTMFKGSGSFLNMGQGSIKKPSALYPLSQIATFKTTASANPGCEYSDNTFAELGECGMYNNDGYMCVNYVSPAKLAQTWTVHENQWGSLIMPAPVTVPYQIKYEHIQYSYPVDGFMFWQKTPLNVPATTVENKPVSSYTQYDMGLAITPYVNGNYFVASEPAYCTSNGKQPWINWVPKDLLGDFAGNIYPAQPCLRAHDNQQDCETPISSHCQINSAHPNIWTKSHVKDAVEYHFNECKDYVTQSGCEGAYMGYNDYGNTAGFTPWQMPGTGANVAGSCNADPFICGIHCTEYQTHCSTATNQLQCNSTTNSGIPCVWAPPQHFISPCEWKVNVHAGCNTVWPGCAVAGTEGCFPNATVEQCNCLSGQEQCETEKTEEGCIALSNSINPVTKSCDWGSQPACKWGVNGDGEHTISRLCEADGCYEPCYYHAGGDGVGWTWKCGASQRSE